MTVDILAAIDAATEQVCACGCGRQLRTDGHSAWFAGQACQHRWSQRNADGTDEVYHPSDCDDYDGEHDGPPRSVSTRPTPTPSARLHHRPAVQRQPQPVTVEVAITMSDGTTLTYAFPEGVNPDITLESRNDVDDDPQFTYRRRLVTNQHISLTIAANSAANTRTDGVLFTVTTQPDSDTEERHDGH